MVDARKLFTPDEKQQIARALSQAESTTTGEIVCAVASESGRYDRAESMIGLLCALLALAMLHSLNNGGPGSWGAAQPVALGWEVTAITLGFLAGNALGTWFPSLRTRLVSRLEMEEETVRAAWSVFCTHRLSSTRQRGGLLIYFSLFERRVVVLADHGALQALGQPGVEQIRQCATDLLSQAKPLQAMLESLGLAAKLLAEKLPCSQGGGDNELSDELVILHPRP